MALNYQSAPKGYFHVFNEAYTVIYELIQAGAEQVVVPVSEHVAAGELSYLRSFPFDKIKLDQSFVHNLEFNEDAKAIIRAIAGLGASLAMRTTGEGVETQEELDYLKGQGFTEAQGYLFSKPKTAIDVLKLLANQTPSIRAVA